MKEVYETPDIEIVIFETKDIMAGSGEWGEEIG